MTSDDNYIHKLPPIPPATSGIGSCAKDQERIIEIQTSLLSLCHRGHRNQF